MLADPVGSPALQVRYADIEHTHTAPLAFTAYDEGRDSLNREHSSSFVGVAARVGVQIAADQAAAALGAARSALSPLSHMAAPLTNFARNISGSSPGGRQPTHMLIYLNDRTFVDDVGEVLQHEVREAWLDVT
jgi:hypothetical protein